MSMKRIIFFFVVFSLITMVALPVVNAKQTINAETALYTLEYNDDQCLADCEAIIRVDLYKDVQVDASDFDLQYLKRMGVEEVYSDNIYIQEEQTFERTENDYGIVATYYDINVSDSCADFGWSDWGGIEGDCYINSEQIIGEHIVEYDENVWVDIDSYSKLKTKDSPFFIKLVGKKKPMLGSSGVDWQMNAFGDDLSEWAWWDSDWSYKQPITLGTSGLGMTTSVTNDHMILVDINSDNASFWANVDSNGNDVRFVNGAESAEFLFDIDDFNYVAQSAVYWVNVTDTFNNAADITIYLYYGNAGASNGVDSGLAYPASYIFRYSFNEPTGTASQDRTDGGIDSVIGVDGTHGITGQIGDAIRFDGVNDYFDMQVDYDDIGDLTTTLIWWDNVQSLTANNKKTFGCFNQLLSPSDGFAINNKEHEHELSIRSTATERSVLTTGIDKGTWDMYAYVLDAVSGVSQSSVLFQNGDLNYVVGKEEVMNSVPNCGRNMYVGVANNGGSEEFGANVYFDEMKMLNYAVDGNEMAVLYASERRTLLTFGAEEEANVAPDVNVVLLDGVSDTLSKFFSYPVDHNMTITVSVRDPDNNYLYLDLNYNTSKAEGGTSIVDDYNLYANCSTDFSSDFNCTYDFDYSGVADGNYFIIAKVSDLSATDWNASDFANGFEIGDYEPDVNITLLDGAADSGYNYFSYEQDGNVTITFNVSDRDNNYLLLDLNYNTSASAGGSVIVDDLNLYAECATDFTSSQTCTYDFNISSTLVVDNNYWIVANLYDADSNAIDFSDMNFVVDNTPPVCTADTNSFWQTSDANVHITCTDATAGVKNTYYYLDTDVRSSITLGGLTLYDTNIFINSDGNYALTFLASDMADNNTTNYDSNVILIDTTAPIVDITSHATGGDSSLSTITFFVTEIADVVTTFTINTGASDFVQATDCVLTLNTWTCSFTETSFLPEVSFTLLATSTDENGYSGNESVTFTFVSPPAEVGGAGGGGGSPASPSEYLNPGSILPADDAVDVTRDGDFTDLQDDYDGDGLENGLDLTPVGVPPGSNAYDADGDGDYTGGLDDFDGDGMLNFEDDDPYVSLDATSGAIAGLDLASVLRQNVNFLGYELSNMLLLTVIGFFVSMMAAKNVGEAGSKRLWLLFTGFVVVGWALTLLG